MPLIENDLLAPGVTVTTNVRSASTCTFVLSAPTFFAATAVAPSRMLSVINPVPDEKYAESHEKVSFILVTPAGTVNADRLAIVAPPEPNDTDEVPVVKPRSSVVKSMFPAGTFKFDDEPRCRVRIIPLSAVPGRPLPAAQQAPFRAAWAFLAAPAWRGAHYACHDTSTLYFHPGCGIRAQQAGGNHAVAIVYDGHLQNSRLYRAVCILGSGHTGTAPRQLLPAIRKGLRVLVTEGIDLVGHLSPQE